MINRNNGEKIQWNIFVCCFQKKNVLGVLCLKSFWNIRPTVAVTHWEVFYSPSSSCDVFIYLLLAASWLFAVLGITLFPLMLYLPSFTLFLCVFWLAQSQLLSLAVWLFHQWDHGLSTCPCMVVTAQGSPAVYYASASLKSLMEIFCFVNGFWIYRHCLAFMYGFNVVFLCDYALLLQFPRNKILIIVGAL